VLVILRSELPDDLGIALGDSRVSVVTEPRLIDRVLVRARVDLHPTSAPPSLARLSAARCSPYLLTRRGRRTRSPGRRDVPRH